jgi:hypothetical protein
MANANGQHQRLVAILAAAGQLRLTVTDAGDEADVVRCRLRALPVSRLRSCNVKPSR